MTDLIFQYFIFGKKKKSYPKTRFKVILKVAVLNYRRINRGYWDGFKFYNRIIDQTSYTLVFPFNNILSHFFDIVDMLYKESIIKKTRKE